MVEAVELEGLHQAADVLARGGGPGLVGAVEHLGHHHGRENPEDDHDHHDFDQGKAALAAPMALGVDACDIHLDVPWLDSIRREVLQEDMSEVLKNLGRFGQQAVKGRG